MCVLDAYAALQLHHNAFAVGKRKTVGEKHIDEMLVSNRATIVGVPVCIVSAVDKHRNRLTVAGTDFVAGVAAVAPQLLGVGDQFHRLGTDLDGREACI